MITDRSLIGSVDKGYVSNQVTRLGYLWYMAVKVIYDYFYIDCPCINNSTIAYISCQCSPALDQIFIDVQSCSKLMGFFS